MKSILEIEIPDGYEFDADNSVINVKPVLQKVTPEELFDSMWEGCVIHHDDEYPDSIFYMKDGKCWFELDSINNILWCNYQEVWIVLEKLVSPNYYDVQMFIKTRMEERYKVNGIAPLAFWI